MKIWFKEFERIYIMKVREILENGDFRVIDGSIVEKNNVIKTEEC